MRRRAAGGRGGELRLWHFTVGIEMRNLLGLEYRQSEFYYASNFESPIATPSRVALRHFVAGELFFVMGTLSLHVEELFRRGRTPASGHHDVIGAWEVGHRR